jgi:hypothetical protein
MQRWSLHEILQRETYNHALISTFGFSARFFEEYCLERFRAFQENGNISILVDRGQYEELLENAADDRLEFPKKANLRYLLQGIRAGQCFHPKIFLFGGKDRGLLIIGSANLTRDGLCSNAELISCFKFVQGKDEDALPLFQQAFDYFFRLSDRCGSDSLASNIQAFEREEVWLSQAQPLATESLPKLLHNEDRSLLEQLRELVGSYIDELHVLSRYYDSKPSLLEVVRRDFGVRRIYVYTQNSITTLTRDWLEHSSVKQGITRIQLCRYADREYSQPLHAKAYAFKTSSKIVLAIGSANFTTAALGLTSKNGNAEVLLVYPPFSQNEFDAVSLFDPLANGMVLTEPSQLLTAPSEEPSEVFVRSAPVLESAWVDETMVILRGRDLIQYDSCILQQQGRRSMKLPVKAKSDEEGEVQLSDQQAAQLKQNATVARVLCKQRGGDAIQSNPVLVSNLQHFVTGRDIRRERQLAEARESPAKFISLLNELCKAGDEERLKNFLTYCDIPLELAARGMRRASQWRGLPPDTHELRILGTRNLAHFQSLHEAVMDFVRRHRARLDRHVESGTADGINNFAQILLSVAGLLVNQIERLIAGFESAEGDVVLSPPEWHQIRQQLNDYYRTLADLLELTATNYVDGLLHEYPREVVRERLYESLSDIHQIWSRALELRDQLNELQKQRLQVNGSRPVRGPGFFKSVLADAKWGQFSGTIRSLQHKLHERFAA